MKHVPGIQMKMISGHWFVYKLQYDVTVYELLVINMELLCGTATSEYSL